MVKCFFPVSKKARPTSTVFPFSRSSSFVSNAQERYLGKVHTSTGFRLVNLEFTKTEFRFSMVENPHMRSFLNIWCFFCLVPKGLGTLGSSY